MKEVRAKKHLGQHFLTDLGIAKDIATAITGHGGYKAVLEIGPGMGVLTQFLLEQETWPLYVAEIDTESVKWLNVHYPKLQGKILEGDYLQMNMKDVLPTPYAVIGNFPYNISSQIFFKVLEDREDVPEVVGMLQKEVAERLSAGHGNRDYGILTVLLQTWYDVEYLFTVPEHVFNPPPKVKSGVIRVRRNTRTSLPVDEKLHKMVVKQSFSQRRKTLRNALKSLNLPPEVTSLPTFDLRAEQLSVEDFITLTQTLQPYL